MITPAALLVALQGAGVEYFSGVPDSLLREFCTQISDAMPPERHVIAADEGGALAFAAGVNLGGGGVPLVYLQNSGFGNLINPLLSLVDQRVYAIPVVLLIGWRGEPHLKDEPQHMAQGLVQESLHRALDLPTRILGPESSDSDLDELVTWAVDTARIRSGPVAILVRRGSFSPSDVPKDAVEGLPSREEALAGILSALPREDVIVATTGMISREIFELRVHRGEGHERDFLTVGSMGHASSIALGLATSCATRSVWCLDGDGSLLMHMGSMAIIGARHPRNLRHVVLNNGAHDSVGGQPTVARLVDLRQIAHACGYVSSQRVTEMLTLGEAIGSLAVLDGPGFLDIWVRRGVRPNLGRPTTSPMENKLGLQRHLGAAGLG